MEFVVYDLTVCDFYTSLFSNQRRKKPSLNQQNQPVQNQQTLRIKNENKQTTQLIIKRKWLGRNEFKVYILIYIVN